MERWVRQLMREEYFLTDGNEFRRCRWKNERKRWSHSFVELGSGFGAILPSRRRWSRVVDHYLLSLKEEVLWARTGLEKYVAQVGRNLGYHIVPHCVHGRPFLRNLGTVVPVDADLEIVFLGLCIDLERELDSC